MSHSCRRVPAAGRTSRAVALALLVAFEPRAIWRALQQRHGRRVLGVLLAVVWAVGFGSAWLGWHGLYRQL